MKIKYFYSALALSLISLLTLAAINKGDDGKPVKTNKDVIKFSHAVHKDVTDCAGCHSTVPESTTLNMRLLPEKSVCATCHDVNDEKNCKQCHYDNVNEPLILDKSKVIFNHKFHLTDQKLVCENCHKGLDKVAYSFESPEAKPGMTVCYSCHNNKTVATNICESCHISTANLLPEDHKQVSFAKNHKFHATSEKANCQMCHDNSFCESCHASTTMINEKNTARDFYVPYSPQKFIDNTKQQVITRVHDLNYQYTHGIDAKGKTSECQSCHQVETFCVSCHNSAGKGDFALDGTTPVSHRQANFVTIGVGSGGGQHAILARRDIESCSSCHDVQGADPNCILCHNDPDGRLNTNPKTHVLGYMRSEHGDWHTDRGSVCFSCHTDANAHPGGIKGIGFCGYCHK
jgi:Cytochrome c7 and related cytochrome c